MSVEIFMIASTVSVIIIGAIGMIKFNLSNKKEKRVTSLIRRETKKEFGSYLIDVSKFIVAGAIIDRVFNGSDEVSTIVIFVFAFLFLLFGLFVVNVINKEGGKND